MKHFLKLSLLLSIVLVSCSKTEEELNTYIVNISSNDMGVVEGIPNNNEILEGKTITLTAIPKNEEYKDYIFDGWEGTISSTKNPLRITITDNTQIYAKFRLKNYWEDEIYSQLSDDPESYIRVFIADAKRHGVDLSHVNLDTIEFEIREMTGVAYSLASCDPNNVRISLNENMWEFNTEIFEKEWKFRWLVGVVYHELGHDLLGLAHLCAGGHVMTGTHQSPQGECNGREENLYDLKYNNEDLVTNWQRAISDMFSGKNQAYIECNNTSSKGNNIIKEEYEIPQFNN